MKIMNAHTFSGAEENLIRKALYDMANNFLKENGVDDADKLTRAQRLYYDEIMRVYNGF